MAAAAAASYNQLLPAGRVASCVPPTPDAAVAAGLFAVSALVSPAAWMLARWVGPSAHRAAFVAGRVALILLGLLLMPLILISAAPFTGAELIARGRCGVSDLGAYVITAAMVLVPLLVTFVADALVVRRRFSWPRFSWVTAAEAAIILAVYLIDGIFA